jgi:uncharacterized protein DUF3987
MEPANLWVGVIAAPGEGKSPAFGVATQPIVAIEHSLRDATRREVAEAQTILRVEQSRLTDAERDAAKARPEKREELEAVARDLAASWRVRSSPVANGRSRPPLLNPTIGGPSSAMATILACRASIRSCSWLSCTRMAAPVEGVRRCECNILRPAPT